MSDVFISYSRKDSSFIHTLSDALQAKNFDSWVDWEDIPKGTDWWNEICAGIEGADTFIFVISPDSLMSEVCHREVGHARTHHKRILPVVRREVDDKVLAGEWFEKEWETTARDNWQALRHINWQFFRETDSFEMALAELITSLTTDIDHVKLHTRMTVRAREWEAQGRKPEFLLRGDDLRTAEGWLAISRSKDPKPTDLHAEYIRASAAEELRNQQAELALQREVAEKRRQSANRLRLLAGALAIFLVVALGLSWFAFNQRNDARHATTTAENRAASLRSLALTTSAQQAISQSNPELAIALAVEANRLADPPPDAIRTLYDAAYAPHKLREFESNGFIDAALSPNGKTALGYFSGQDEGLYLWDIATGERLRSSALDSPEITSLGVSDLAISADGRRAAIIGFSGFAVVWDIESWRQIAVLNPERVVDSWGVEQDGFGVAINADGSQVLAGVFGALIRWDVDTGNTAQVYSQQTADGSPFLPQLVEWSPDGRTAFVASYNSSAPGRLIDLTTGDILHELIFSYPLNLAGFTSAVFSADGQQLITGHQYYGAVVWTVSDGAVSELLPNSDGGSVGAVAVSPNGHYYAVADGANIQIWSRSWAGDNPVRLMTLPKPALADLVGLSFRPDNQTLLAAYQSDELTQLYLPALILWQVTSDGELPESTLPGIIRVYSPDGCCALYLSEDNKLNELDLETGQILHTLDHPIDSDMIYSGDGHRVLMGGGESDRLLLWDLETNAATPLLETFSVSRFIASPDGEHFAVLVSQGNSADILLITKDGEPVRQFDHLTDSVLSSMTFSADSKRLIATTTDFLEDMLVWEVATGSGTVRQPHFGDLEASEVNYRGINARSYLLLDGEDLLIVPDQSDMVRVNPMTGRIETIYEDSNRSIYHIAFNEQVIVANLCLEEVEFECQQAGLRIWDAATGARLADIPVDGILDTLDLGRTQILAPVGFNQFHYRLEAPLQLIARLEEEGRIRSFSPDECRRFALSCDSS